MPAPEQPPQRLHILSTLALAGVLRALNPDADIVLSPTKVLLDRIEAGETADVAILTQQAVADLCDRGVLRVGSQVDLARSYVGFAVRAGASHPPIATVEDVRRLLIDTPSIAYSRAGASGLFFAGLLDRMGLADIVNAKAVIVPSGFTAERLINNEVALAVQQISELKEVEGVEIVGRLPDAIGSTTIFTAAVFAGCTRADQAAQMIDTLRNAGALYDAAGLEGLG